MKYIIFAIAVLALFLFPNAAVVQAHLKTPIKPIPMCKSWDGKPIVTHHETEGNVSAAAHKNNCA